MALAHRIAFLFLLLVWSSPIAVAQEATPAEPDLKPAEAVEAVEKAESIADPPDDVQLTFNFRYQPWQDVLDWFADQAGLSLLLEAPPPGTFNYRDSRSYTPAEALDVLNGVLLTKGYTLVRRGRMLVLVNLEDGVPPNLVPDVSLAELDERGEYELIRVLFPVWNMSPEQAATEVQPLLGPQGKVVTLPQARQIQVTETAGRLRAIRSVVNAVEQPELGTAGLREFELQYITFDAAMPTIRQMLGIPAEAYSTPDGSMQITRSATGEKILFRGTAQHAARLKEILRLIDVPEAAAGVDGAPQLEVYPVTTADPAAVVKVLETLLRDDPNVTLTTDEESGHVIAFATPPQQATIRATIEQMQKDSRQVDVIALSSVDPQVAVFAINKLFGGTGEEPDPKAPRVDADIESQSLLVRGTATQLEQIRALLRKLGETDGEDGGRASKQSVRLLPLSGAAARSAIMQIEEIWPSVRPNRIRIVAPTATIPTYRPSESAEEAQDDAETRGPAAESTDEMRDVFEILRGSRSNEAPTEPERAPDGADTRRTNERSDSESNSASNRRADVFRYAAEELGQTEPSPAPGKGAPIIIAPGPGGTLIASDDLEALDQLEELLAVVAGKSTSSGREYAVFYLKYSKASTIAEVLAAIFGGSTSGSDRGIIGDMASNALGDVGGALMGDLLLGGGGGGGFTSGSVDVVPDARLNALIVHAKPADIDTIEQLLKVLDQRTGPENVEADGQARSIPVYNTTVTEIAEIVQQVYQDRLAGVGSVMSPQEMMRMIRGGPNTEQQIQKMSIAIDTRNNALIVRAPDPLFEEVRQLVAELDQSLADSPETTRVVSLRHTNSSAVQQALTSILGNVSTNTTESGDGDRRRRDRDDDDSPEDRARRAMRRNWEMMREMRRMQERMGGGDRGGGFDRSRFFQGGGGGGFPGRGGGDDRGGRGGGRD
jgi:type II secretory pathway component GspD/PulD (secretin)